MVAEAVAPESGEVKIRQLQETPQFVKLLVYGYSGAGKTVFASTAPRPLLIDVEGGTMSIRQFGRKVDVVRITSFEQLKSVYNSIETDGSKWDTIIIDSLTELMKSSMTAVMGEVVAQNPRRDPDIPGLQEYGKNAEIIRKVIRRFRDLPKHVIFTCLTLDTTDQDTGLPVAKPALTGKMANEVPAYMDVVGRLIKRRNREDATKIDRILQLDSDDTFVAKSRHSGLGSELLFPDFAEMVKAVQSSK